MLGCRGLPSSGCDDGVSAEAVSVARQASSAGVVLIGEVEQILRIRLDQEVTIASARYLKGCGPSRVRVTGFRQGVPCAVQSPRIGTRVVLFGCEGTSQEVPIALNDLGRASGAFVWTPQLEVELETALLANTSQPVCSGRFLFYDCVSARAAVAGSPV